MTSAEKHRRRALQRSRMTQIGKVLRFYTTDGRRGIVRKDGSFLADSPFSVHRLLTSSSINHRSSVSFRRKRLRLARTFRHTTRLP